MGRGGGGGREGGEREREGGRRREGGREGRREEREGGKEGGKDREGGGGGGGEEGGREGSGRKGIVSVCNTCSTSNPPCQLQVPTKWHYNLHSYTQAHTHMYTCTYPYSQASTLSFCCLQYCTVIVIVQLIVPRLYMNMHEQQSLIQPRSRPGNEADSDCNHQLVLYCKQQKLVVQHGNEATYFKNVILWFSLFLWSERPVEAPESLLQQVGHLFIGGNRELVALQVLGCGVDHHIETALQV